jgi:hypothetical protein
MTDHFALLGEARRPWLDPDELKKKYFARSRVVPPDAELNEAFRVLSDPKLRLQHYLMLEGADLSAGRPVPSGVAELFWNTGKLLREAENGLLQHSTATSTLGRALLQPERAKLEGRLGEWEEKLRVAYEAELSQLCVTEEKNIPQLIERYDAISYLTKLREQMAEKRLQCRLA